MEWSHQCKEQLMSPIWNSVRPVIQFLRKLLPVDRRDTDLMAGVLDTERAGWPCPNSYNQWLNVTVETSN